MCHFGSLFYVVIFENNRCGRWQIRKKLPVVGQQTVQPTN
jgi:hypothetical protein